MRTWILSAVLLVSVLGFVREAIPCTTFCLHKPGRGAIIAKSYDWDYGEARVMVNRAGVAKKALVLTGKPHEWTSAYASLTFNQYGREFPNGGINEAGLVVEVMVLAQSKFPENDERGTVNELQWIQYQLDSFARVKEAVAAADKLRVAPISGAGTLHYMVCDKTGACAAFEYLDGVLVKTTGKEMPVPVLANSTYADSREYLKNFQGFGGKNPVPSDASSLSRFVIAASATKESKKDPIQAAFATLDRVRNGDYTKWNIVYDTGDMRLHWRSLGHPTIKEIDLDKVFAKAQRTCKTPVKTLDMNIDDSGDVTSLLTDYKSSDNLELVKTTMKRVGGLPDTLIAFAAAYPDSLPCTL